MSQERLFNFIGGERRSSESGQWLEHRAPKTGQVDYFLPRSTAEDVELAVKAAAAAYPSWSKLHATARAQYLETIAQILDQRADELALAESEDQGKPLSLARRMDVQRAIDNFKYFAGHIRHRMEQSSSHLPGQLNYTLRTPLG